MGENFSTFLVGLLIANGLCSTEAEALLEVVKTKQPEMQGRWNEGTASYPEMTKNVLWAATKRIASEWLAANKPNHFARPMFETEG